MSASFKASYYNDVKNICKFARHIKCDIYIYIRKSWKILFYYLFLQTYSFQEDMPINVHDISKHRSNSIGLNCK